jgi:hypothetical protein
MHAIIIIFLIGGLLEEFYKEQNVEATGVATSPV